MHEAADITQKEAIVLWHPVRSAAQRSMLRKFPWLKFLRLLLSVAWSVEAEGLHHEMLDGVSRIHVHL